MTSLPVPLEADEAETLVAWLRIHNITFSHIPGETGGTLEAKRRAIRMKRQGYSKGFPDYVILIGGHMVFVELKRQRRSVTSPEQLAWIEAINAIDNCQAFIAKGANAVITILEALLIPRDAKPTISPRDYF